MRIQPGWLTNLSLDAPVVGTLWLALFAKVYRVPVGWELLWLLFSAIWLIYVVDRLVEWDYSLMKERHNFHQNHRKAFRIVAISVVITNLWMIWRYPLRHEFYGSAVIVGTGAVLYLLFSYTAKDSPAKEWGKNILVSILFAMGCTLPVWTILVKEHRVTFSFAFEFFSLVLLILCNLRLIGADEADQKTFPKEVALAGFLILMSAAIIRNQLTLVWILSLLLMTGVWFSRFSRFTRTAYDIALIIPAAALYVLAG